MKNVLKLFAEKVSARKIEIYNEFSLQHELGIFLRKHLRDYKIQFERNISHFNYEKNDFIKKEIDISIFSHDLNNLYCAIELKFPRNGQHPEQMFSFCKDIAFVEQLKKAGFRKAFFVVFADDPLFYEGSGNGIYGYFRQKRILHGIVQKPTGRKDAEVVIKGSYKIYWNPVRDKLQYAFIEAGKWM
jgi:hypothetical protein